MNNNEIKYDLNGETVDQSTVLKDYVFKNKARIDATEEEPLVSNWLVNPSTKKETYTSETLSSPNVQQQMKMKAKLDALKGILEQAASMVDLQP